MVNLLVMSTMETPLSVRCSDDNRIQASVFLKNNAIFFLGRGDVVTFFIIVVYGKSMWVGVHVCVRVSPRVCVLSAQFWSTPEQRWVFALLRTKPCQAQVLGDALLFSLILGCAGGWCQLGDLKEI